MADDERHVYVVKLVIARHGDASPGSDDAARALSRHGRADMERLALFLGTSGVRVDRVFHGPRRRTKETAEILGRSISDAVEIEALPVLDTDAPLDSLLSTIDAWTEDALLVGHFPTVEELTASLVGAGSQGRLSFSPVRRRAWVAPKAHGGSCGCSAPNCSAAPTSSSELRLRARRRAPEPRFVTSTAPYAGTPERAAA